MNLQHLSLTRLFSRGKRTTGTQAERVDESQIPAASFGAMAGTSRKQEPAEDILAETSQAGCQHSGAGMTAFVP